MNDVFLFFVYSMCIVELFLGREIALYDMGGF